MKSIISPKELNELKNNHNVLIFDVSNHHNAKENYFKKHLKGAFFIDVDTQLAHIKDDVSLGGRHPLPTLEKFSAVLSELGIKPENHIIIYDDKSGANAAARFWWMLKAVGHEKVQVLDGGYQKALEIGFPVSTGREKLSQRSNYKCKAWKLPMVDISAVEKASQNPSNYIIDVRGKDRYNGEIEPFDPIAGHIPNAHNMPYTSNLDAEGFFLSVAELQEQYNPIFQSHNSEEIIVHCGSGVTACHTLLAMDYAGFNIPNLYVGSWSEWCRNNKPMITKK